MRHLRMFFSSPPIPGTWFKVLNPDYTQKHGRREMFEGFKQRSDGLLVPILTAEHPLP
jgi:hypothetical protein